MANKTYTVADFISDFWINQVSWMYEQNDFASFYLVGVGIEFLGRCLDDPNLWDAGEGKSKERFHKAINTLPSLARYKPYIQSNNYLAVRDRLQGLYRDVERLESLNPALKNITNVKNDLGKCAGIASSGDETYDLYATLRCGLVHEGIPKTGLVLAHGYEAKHLQKDTDGLFLDIKCLSDDFRQACEYLITRLTDGNVLTNIRRKCIKIHVQGGPVSSAGGVSSNVATGDPATCPMGKICTAPHPTEGFTLGGNNPSFTAHN